VPWTIGEVFTLAWARFKLNASVPVVAFLIYTLLTQSLGQGPVLLMRALSPGLDKTAIGALVQFVALVGTMGVGAFLMPGFMRIVLAVARGRQADLGTLFGGGDRFLAMLGLQVSILFVVGLGFLLLIVPGIIVALGFSYAQFFVVDANLGPFEAMRASWAATRGQRGRIFGFGFVGLGVIFLGMLALIVGVIPAAAVIYIAWAIAYTRASGREPAMPDTAR
jgi:uncharacterized membrane protein